MNNVVIIGRPNVGKSTLFNKILGRRKAVTSPIAGTTRDIVSSQSSWQGRIFQLFDTGGFTYQVKKDLINDQVQEQIQFALKKADIILFVTDSKTGLTNYDFDFAKKLKQIKKPIILVANKADSEYLQEQALNFIKLGLGQPQIISAGSGTGVGELLDLVVSNLKTTEEKKEEQETCPPEPKERRWIKVGLFGRPNVGKSSLINALLGEKKIIVSSIPGTTRDTLENNLTYQNQNLTLIDSAGIKRKKDSKFGIEKFSVHKSLQVIKDCDIVLYILDASDYLTRQDKRIAQRILESKACPIIIINKVDLVKQSQKHLDDLAKSFRYYLNFLYFCPLVFVSAKTDQNIKQIFDLILKINQERNKVIPKEELTAFLKNLLKDFPPERNKKTLKRPNLIELIQFQTNPPKFNLYLEGPQTVAPKYLEFLKKKLHEQFGFLGAPLHISVARKR